MKKWLLIFIFVLIVVIIYVTPISVSNNEDPIIIHEEDIDWDSFPHLNKEVTRDQIYQGNLLLVDEEHPVKKESIPSNIIELDSSSILTEGYSLLNQDLRLSKEVAESFLNVVQSAKQDGVSNFLMSSGFRNHEEQQVLFNEKGEDYALPAGASEHNLGLSIDIGSTNGSIAISEEGDWLQENAWKHGFVLRYPQGKTEITGIQYEPWHYRYVGNPHSAIMYEKNFTLEEYLEFLKKKSISVELQGTKYLIYYFPISELSAQVAVPENGEYYISGNNKDGVIVTVELDGELTGI